MTNYSRSISVGQKATWKLVQLLEPTLLLLQLEGNSAQQRWNENRNNVTSVAEVTFPRNGTRLNRTMVNRFDIQIMHQSNSVRLSLSLSSSSTSTWLLHEIWIHQRHLVVAVVVVDARNYKDRYYILVLMLTHDNGKRRQEKRIKWC